VPSAPDGFSFEAWIDPDDAGDMVVFDHGAPGGGPAVYIHGGALRFRMPDGTVVSSTGPLPADFFHVHARWDGIYASLWVNGVKQDEAKTTKPPSGTSSLYVGYGNVIGLGLVNAWFRGLIDEVSYYAFPLRDPRIRDHWFADPPAPAPSTGVPSPPVPPAPPSGGGGGGGGGGGAAKPAPTAIVPVAPANPVSAPSLTVPPVTTAKPTTTTRQPAKPKAKPKKKHSSKKHKGKAKPKPKRKKAKKPKR
jgi:hypothetical protein